jgi:hypothetical protein
MGRRVKERGVFVDIPESAGRDPSHQFISISTKSEFRKTMITDLITMHRELAPDYKSKNKTRMRRIAHLDSSP